MLSTLSKIFSRPHFEIFFVIMFSQKTGFEISCKLFIPRAPMGTICMKCQGLFSWKKIRKNIINLWSAEYAQKVVNVDKRAKMALYRSPDYQTSFESIDE